eukprot:gb/GECH01012351.1/.p1 GENE.gb/GECH01012351.1/~~gb/GECH01012351.1/.p1  ORF type:complete len:865 (+),score=209.23 gb/GECH01012351.1/:1-2595(+)
MPKPRVRSADAATPQARPPRFPHWDRLFASMQAPTRPRPHKYPQPSTGQVTALFQHARSLFEAEVQVFEQQHGAFEQLLRKFTDIGAVADKMAAVVVQVRKAPVHQMRLIDVLLDLMNSNRQEVVRDAINAAAGLFVRELLPPRTLVFFQDRPLGWAVHAQGSSKADKVLTLWYFEHQLKERFTKFVNALLKLSNMYTVRIVHHAFVRASGSLAAQTEEQRERLLQILINQLREEGAVGAYASFRLQQLLDNTPHLRRGVVSTLEAQLLRLEYPTAAYYTCVALGQLRYAEDDTVVPAAAHLFLSVFRHHLPRKGQKHTRMHRALAYTALAGLQRVLPFHPDLASDRSFDEYVPAVLKSAYRGRSFAIRLSALRVLALLAPHNDHTRDRFYRALYYAAKDVDGVRTSRLSALYVATLQNAARRDIADRRVMALVKRVLQTAHQLPAHLTSRLLFLGYAAMSAHPGLRALLAHPEEPTIYGVDPDDVHDNNNNDDDPGTGLDLGKRDGIDHDDELDTNSTGKEEDDDSDDDEDKNSQVHNSDSDDSDDEIEIVDGDESDENDSQDGSTRIPDDDSASETESLEENKDVDEGLDTRGGVANDNDQETNSDTDYHNTPSNQGSDSHKTITYGYDSNHRDPEHAHAEDTCLWEITGLERHYDPAVRYGATTLIHGRHNPFFGMVSPATVEFLDRFTARSRPKVRAVRSVTAPKPQQRAAVEELSFSSTELARMPMEEVPPTARFARRFHDLHEDTSKTENLHPHLEHHADSDLSDDGLDYSDFHTGDMEEDDQEDNADDDQGYGSEMSDFSFSELDKALLQRSSSDAFTNMLSDDDVGDADLEEGSVGEKRKKKKKTSKKKNKRRKLS